MREREAPLIQVVLNMPDPGTAAALPGQPAPPAASTEPQIITIRPSRYIEAEVSGDN